MIFLAKFEKYDYDYEVNYTEYMLVDAFNREEAEKITKIYRDEVYPRYSAEVTQILGIATINDPVIHVSQKL